LPIKSAVSRQLDNRDRIVVDEGADAARGPNASAKSGVVRVAVTVFKDTNDGRKTGKALH
jgi:hypothetical protein